MPEAEIISTLVGHLYDAALDPALWPNVLAQVKGFVGGATASLVTKDAASRSMDLYYDDGSIDPYWLGRYHDEFAKFDPSTDAAIFRRNRPEHRDRRFHAL